MELAAICLRSRFPLDPLIYREMKESAMCASSRSLQTNPWLAAACFLAVASQAAAFQQAAPPPPRPQQPIIYGMQFQQTRDGQIVVSTIYPDGPAAKAGLQPGDIIRGVASKPVASGRELTRALTGRQPGERIVLQVTRAGHPTTMELVADASVAVLPNGAGAPTPDQRAFGWNVRAAENQ